MIEQADCIIVKSVFIRGIRNIRGLPYNAFIKYVRHIADYSSGQSQQSQHANDCYEVNCLVVDYYGTYLPQLHKILVLARLSTSEHLMLIGNCSSVLLTLTIHIVILMFVFNLTVPISAFHKTISEESWPPGIFNMVFMQHINNV